jgi:hypothetical protein
VSYACPTWGYAAIAELLKQQNRIFCAVENLDKLTQSTKGMWLSKFLKHMTI